MASGYDLKPGGLAEVFMFVAWSKVSKRIVCCWAVTTLSMAKERWQTANWRVVSFVSSQARTVPSCDSTCCKCAEVIQKHMRDTRYNAVRASNQLESKSFVRDHQQNNAIKKPPKCIFARARRKYRCGSRPRISFKYVHITLIKPIPSYIFIIVIIYTPPTIPT